MKTYWTLWLGLMCLLLANEARQSALSVVDGHYAVMSYVLTVVGIGLLLGGVAKSLLLRQAKESSGLLRVNNK
jgi:uncharacterized membrane protein